MNPITRWKVETGFERNPWREEEKQKYVDSMNFMHVWRYRFFIQIIF
jgi:hypothetical protein